ncbi:MAG: hypothetical protein ABSA02_33945 [Trebonia sp.]
MVPGADGAGAPADFRLELAALLHEGYAGTGGTVVMATHDHDFALAAGAREVRLSEGKVAADDTVAAPPRVTG